MASVISKWGDRTAPLDVSVQLATDSVSKLNEGVNLYDNDNYTNEGDLGYRNERGFTSELNEGINPYDHDNYTNDEGNLGYSKSKQRSQPKTANNVSKRIEYITKDEDDCRSQFPSRSGSTSDVNKWSGNTFETSLVEFIFSMDL
ncbi:hypothetical protein HAX54_051875 [Datura stramonium]|uniref:Uncharacterized protein n=1 Tax=Datura stramonium TaxID=4076 RepID=A0ABS8WQF2_DATST|nr:hypothetical protein [Datura stramonium]